MDSARLRLHQLGSEAETFPSLRLTVSQFSIKRKGRGSSPSSPRAVVMLDSKVVNNTAGPVSLDVLGAVRRWQQEQSGWTSR